jgi:amino acid transporter
MNSYTKTPVNTVWFSCGLAILLGLLVFAGKQAIDAVFSLSVVALYIAYTYVCFISCLDLTVEADVGF